LLLRPGRRSRSSLPCRPAPSLAWSRPRRSSITSTTWSTTRPSLSDTRTCTCASASSRTATASTPPSGTRSPTPTPLTS
ncbi:hypothetical protein FBU59_004236, partial [Linderina macrospora]